MQAGTATVVKEVGKPIAGKTGTTNDEKDAWFVGFSPDLVVGIYVGYDKPRNLGRGMTGGHLAAPIAQRLPEACARGQAGDSVQGAGRHQADPRRCQDRHARRPGTGRTILEAFKPGTRRRIITRSSASPTPMAAACSLLPHADQQA